MADPGPTGLGRWAWRLWLPPLLVVLIMMAAIAYRNGHVGRVPSRPQLILVLTGAIALLSRMRYPLTVTIITVLAGAALPLTGQHLVLVDVATIVALYTLATLRGRRTVWPAGAFAAVALTAAAVPWQPGGLLDLANLVPANYVLIAVAAGEATRNRRALLAEVHARAVLAERTREQEGRRRVREERIRIARDLHDVVAHHITLVNAQAGVAHHLMSTHPDQAREALAGIRDTSRTALYELRATVGLLRQDDDPPASRRPAPRFADLNDLLDGFRKSGFDIAETHTGSPRPLSGAADLAAYRVVQEALTNAGKHGTARRATLRVQYTDTALHLTVINPAHAGHRGPGTGHGLIGMRERVEAAGGTSTAGRTPDDTFTVYATLPVQPPAAEPAT